MTATRSWLLLAISTAGCLVYVVWGPGWMVRLAQHVPDWSYLPLLSSVHVVGLFAWTLGLVLVLRHLTGRRWTWPMIALPIACAVASELAQVVIPRHDPDLCGGLSSLAGVLLALLVLTRLPSPASPTATAQPSV